MKDFTIRHFSAVPCVVSIEYHGTEVMYNPVMDVDPYGDMEAIPDYEEAIRLSEGFEVTPEVMYEVAEEASEIIGMKCNCDKCEIRDSCIHYEKAKERQEEYRKRMWE